MARILTGDKMIESVRKRTFVPDDTSTFDDDDILDIIDEEMNVQVLEKLQTLHGDNLTVTVDIPRNEKGHYKMPDRALGNKLRDVSMIIGTELYELGQISPGALSDYSSGNYAEYDMDLFYLENNKVKIVSPDRGYETIRMRFYIRPNVLTKLDQAGIIDNIIVDENANTLTLSLSQVGKNFTSTKLYDLVGSKSPNKIEAYNLKPISVTTSTSSGSIVFTLSDIVDYGDLIIGDYVTLEGETPVPNIPTEMHPLLAQAAAINVLESLGDSEALANANARMDKMSRSVQTLIDNRVELSPKKIRPRNGVLSNGNKLGHKGRR